MSIATNARIVTDGELVTFAKRQHELFTRFNKGVYQDPSEVLDGLQLLIEGKQPEIIPTLAKQIEAGVVDLDSDPYVPDGWKVKEHKKGGQFTFDLSKMDLYLSEG